MNYHQDLLVCVVEGDEKWFGVVLAGVCEVAAASPRAERAWIAHSAGGTLRLVLSAPLPLNYYLTQRVVLGWDSASPTC